MKTCSQTTIRNVPPVNSSGDKPPMTSISQANKQLPKHTYGNNNVSYISCVIGGKLSYNSFL